MAEDLVDRSPAVIYSARLRPNFRVTQISANFSRITGYPRDLFLDRPFPVDLVHPDDLARVTSDLGRPLQGKTRVLRYRMRFADDDWHWIRDEFHGEDDVIYGAWIDVTAHVLAEEESIAQWGFPRALIDNLPGIFYVISAEGQFLDWNLPLETVTGYSATELARLHPLELFDGDDQKLIAERIGKVFTDGGADAEAELVTKDRARLRYFFMGRRLLVEGRENLVGMGVDLTARYQAEHGRRRAEMANEAKSRFLAHMSHELRTPLNAIIGFSDAIRRNLIGIGRSQGRYDGYIEDIYQSGTYLLRLIDEILDLAKVEAGELPFHPVMVPIADLIVASLSVLRLEAERNDIALKVEQDDPALEWMLDRTRVKQMLINLLSNAVKFTAAGGSVTISAGRDANGWLRLAVSDTGIGLTKDEIERALQPFGQIDNVFSRRNRGTGLGLPLTRGLAERHGGRFELTSESGRGSTAALSFPP